ncbi:unnamed protein product [Cyprideis torosa]|uniref:Uncharacterized protein n=1 Tax=Cyprideis torosa TaxID=163714 RepID=A0A7R8WAT3_9CRUS|nr:unnamed protein product [Cyprideis torosa]CAG0891395.1 unnamed protein product [Cyprideis torosa]
MDSPGRWHVPFTVLLAVLLDPCHSATFMGSSFHWDPSLTYSLQHPPSLTPVDIWGDYDDSLTNAIEDTSFEGYQKHSFHMKDAKGGVYVMIPDEAANLTDPSYRSKLEEVTRGAGHDESGILEKRSVAVEAVVLL